MLHSWSYNGYPIILPHCSCTMHIYLDYVHYVLCVAQTVRRILSIDMINFLPVTLLVERRDVFLDFKYVPSLGDFV